MTEAGGQNVIDSDFRLLEGVQAGNAQAMVLLFDRYSKLVYSVALRVLHEPAAAEDVTQEVFLRIWRDTPTVGAPSESLRSWFGVLARNRAIDALRRQRTLYSSEEVVLRSPVDVAAQVEDHILYERACAILHALPEEQQRVLNLAFFDGLSHSEISAKLSSPLGTVKSRIRQALLAIRKAGA